MHMYDAYILDAGWEAIMRRSGELLFLAGAILGDALPSFNQITAGVQTKTEAESCISSV